MNADYKPLVNCSMLEYEVQVKPGEFLGAILFGVYTEICREGGATYNVAAKAQTIRIDLLPALKDRLGARFIVKVGPDVIAAAKARAVAIAAAAGDAGERLLSMVNRLYPFQEEGVQWLIQRKSAILGFEMGLGKTPTSLMALAPDDAVVVVCPASLKREWVGFVNRWRPEFKVNVIAEWREPRPGEILIMNYERLPEEKPEITRPIKIIADECHYLKSGKAKRTKFFRVLGRAVRAAGGCTWGLTGTPLPSTPLDLLGILTTFGLLAESFGSYPRFMQLMNGKQDYWGKWTFKPPSAAAAIALQRVLLRRQRQEVLPDLPTITYQDIEVDITKAARRASDEARAAMAAAGINLEAVIDGRQSLGAASESVFTARKLLAEAKIPAMLEKMEAYREEKEPLIVFSAHTAPILAAEKFKGTVSVHGQMVSEQRTFAVRAFQQSVYDCIALTIRSGGVGFTLTRASHIVMVDQEWTPDWNEQAVSRACRIGQTRGVIVKHLIAPDTIDEDVARILEAKRQIINATIDAPTLKAMAVTVKASDLLRLTE